MLIPHARRFAALVLFQLLTCAPTQADPSLSGGLYHSLAVNSAGQVLSWGEDGSGQLGSGRATFVRLPTTVSGFPAGTVASLSAGVFHSFALLNDGQVLAWGDNAEGALGDGGTQSRSSPLPVLGLPAIQRLHSGERHGVAVDRQGRGWTWGLNQLGQLGHSPNAYQSNVPQMVTTSPLADLHGGTGHSLALTTLGEVWAWGDNRAGQLGVATPSLATEPIRTVFPEGTGPIAAIAAGGDQSLAIDGKGFVWAWGDNRFGQLGGGPLSHQPTPQRLSGVSDVIAVSAGRVGMGAITRDGSVWLWGGYQSIATPTRVVGLSGPAVAITMGEYHTLILMSDGSMLGFGGNFAGQLGDGTVTQPAVGAFAKPTGITGPSRLIAAGNKHSMLVDGSGQVYAWGDDLKGQTGSATETTRNVPAVVLNLGSASQVAAGDSHSLALLQDGTVWAWGDNFGGAVGGLVTGVVTQPEAVVGLVDIAQISAARSSSAAIDRTGVAWVWGDNSAGQLARPLVESSVLRAVKGQGLPALKQIALGATHGLALDLNAKVWTWGDNRDGQLGNTIGVGGPTPGTVDGLPGIVAIAAGEGHNLALDSQGRVWAWGRNTFAQVSPSETLRLSVPVLVSGLPAVRAIAAGRGSSLALDVEGRIWGWGLNQFGELGQGTTGFSLNPTLADGDHYAHLSAAPWHTLAARSDGVVWAFGWNDFGQLGEGSFVGQRVAAGVVNPTLDAFLDLQPVGTNLPAPAGKILPFFSQTHRLGGNRRLLLNTDVRIPTQASSRSPVQAHATGYNVYVVAIARTASTPAGTSAGYFLKTRQTGWQAYLGGPLSEYLRGVSQDGSTSILVDILTNDDISLLVGTQFLIGYGLDDAEMLAAQRYRLVYEVTNPP